MRTEILIPIVVALFFITGVSSRADILFWEEKIDITLIASDTVEVEGTYWFKNRAEAELTTKVFYPFPQDSTLPYPFYISVLDGDRQQALTFDTVSDGITFSVTLKEAVTDSFFVIYRQTPLTNRFTYILTTTQLWKKPLHRAQFVITVPRNYSVTYLSYSSDIVTTENNHTKFEFLRENFMPVKDLILEWKCIQ